MANLQQKVPGMVEQIIARVTPVDIPTTAAGWEFGGVLWANSDALGADDPYRYPADKNRKVLRVRYKSPAMRKLGTFLVDVPKHFFDDDGNFTATPAYSTSDTLFVLWTGGGGGGSGYIDLNYQERGGNGGSSVTTEVGCAKWS